MIESEGPHHRADTTEPDSAFRRPPSRDEIIQMRATCEHLSLAVMAMGHELRQGFHILLSALTKMDASVQPPGGHVLLQNSTNLVRRLIRESETLATLGALTGTVPGTMRREAVAFQPVLLDTYKRWQSQADQKGICLKMVSDDATVLSNSHWLGIMLSNILGNAIRYTKSGDVWIEGRVQTPDFLLTIRDSGPGIGEAEMRRVFGTDASPRPSGQGLGLGLNIVRRACDLLGHSLGIRSTPLMGTAVYLRLPIIPALGNTKGTSSTQDGDELKALPI